MRLLREILSFLEKSYLGHNKIYWLGKNYQKRFYPALILLMFKIRFLSPAATEELDLVISVKGEKDSNLIYFQFLCSNEFLLSFPFFPTLTRKQKIYEMQ